MLPDVAEHARFFDHLVELVPASFYYEDEFARLNPRFLSKAERKAHKDDVKVKAKAAKLEKFNPDKAATTLEVQRRRALKSKGQAAADGTSGDGPSPSGQKDADSAGGQPASGQPSGAPVAAGLRLQLSRSTSNRNELLERLHKKVEEARQRRMAAEETAAKAKEWKQNALRGNAAAHEQNAKQPQSKQQQPAGGKRKELAGGQDTPVTGKHAKQLVHGQSAKKPRREGAAAGGGSGDEDPADFKFARIELDDGGRHGKGHHSGRQPSKQVLLKQAEARKMELEALAGTEEGNAKAQQGAWKSALARAGGEKVLDDPKLLRRSLKRESKQREKQGKAWKERVAVQQGSQAARQAKRNDNLLARRQTKLDNKKAKREKKLLRPGFEGRKEGFITGGGGGGK